MSATPLRWVLERMPHEGPMLFLSSVEEVDEQSIRCRADFPRDHILCDEAGGVSPIVAIELFAQAAAALMVYRAARTDCPDVSGYLLGSRGLTMARALRAGESVSVFVKEVWGTGPLAQFDGELWAGKDKVAQGAINVARASAPTT